MKKYELTNETKIIKTLTREITLYRIKAVKDFSSVKSGSLGGWIESENNLSQDGDCWVADEAQVYGKAKVDINAYVYDRAIICDTAWVGGDALVGNDVKVSNNAEVRGKARLFSKAKIYGEAEIHDNATITDYANVYGSAIICGNAIVCGDANVYGRITINGNARIYNNADVYKDEHVLVIGSVSGHNYYTHNYNPTFYHDKDNGISVSYYLYEGKLDKFVEKSVILDGDNKYEDIYKKLVELAELYIDCSGASSVKQQELSQQLDTIKLVSFD